MNDQPRPINIRRLCLYIEKAIRRKAKLLPLKDFQEEFVKLATAVMEDVTSLQAINDFSVTIEPIGHHHYLGKVGLKPLNEFIYINFNIQWFNRYRTTNDPLDNVEYFYDEGNHQPGTIWDWLHTKINSLLK